MNHISIRRLFEDLIKQYETSETHSILFYSQNKPRDFKILADKVKRYNLRLNIILDGGSDDTGEAGVSTGEGDIQR